MYVCLCVLTAAVHVSLFGTLSANIIVCVLLYMLIGSGSVVDNINSQLPDQIRVLGMLTVGTDTCTCSVNCAWFDCKFIVSHCYCAWLPST